MTTIEFIKSALEMSKGWILGMAADMQDAPLTFPTPNGGNHPMWALGHLTYSEANLTQELIKGEANPLAEWKGIFGQRTESVADADRYPSFEEVMAKFEETRTNTLAILDSMTDEDLDKPSHAPEEMKDFFGTNAQCFSGVIIHFAFHGGQFADARRAPLMG